MRHDLSSWSTARGEPLHNDVTYNSASIVLPATMTFGLKGTKITQSGAVFMFTFHKALDSELLRSRAAAINTLTDD